MRYEQERVPKKLANQEYTDGKADNQVVRMSGPKQFHRSLIDSDDTFGSLLYENEKTNIPNIA